MKRKGTIQNNSASGQGNIKTKTVDMIEFIYISEGIFMMGSPEGFGWDGERPLHKVTVSSFWISKYEVTQKQYHEIMEKNPSYFKGDNFPVESVSWNDAKEFCAKFSSKYECKVRLPYEAEWEYACTAGSTTIYYWGNSIVVDGKYCWYGVNSESKTHPVGQKLPNAWGLYDMSGNVWEWCEDWYDDYPNRDKMNPHGPNSGSYRVYRGGSWNDAPVDLLSSRRCCDYPNTRSSSIGFRLVMVGKQ